MNSRLFYSIDLKLPDSEVPKRYEISEKLSIGSPVYQGDVIETEGDSAVNVVFCWHKSKVQI